MIEVEELLREGQLVQRRSVGWGALLLVAALILGLLGVGGTLLYSMRSESPEAAPLEEIDYPGPPSAQVTVVEVRPGETLTQIGESLTEAGVVKTAQAFTRVAQYSDEAQSIQPGYYTLHLYQPGESALEEMLSPLSREGSRVVIPEGLTVSQTYQLVSQARGIPIEDLESAGAQLVTRGLPLGAESLEGLLAPGSYDFDPRAGASEVVEKMLQRFQDETLPLLEGSPDPYQTLIIASIVEEEAGLAADRGKVARVIVNRLEDGMRLQMDSTINYLRGDSKAHLSEADLEVSSPYNTYRNTGLPPTPISAPSQGSLQAALAPEPGEWVYFVASGGGASTFTVSYEEFLAAKEKAQAEGVY